jgi:hypothetical protein
VNRHWSRAVLLAVVAMAARGRAVPAQQDAPLRIDSGRVTVVDSRRDERLAHTVVDQVIHGDSFPGLPRPTHRIIVAIARDAKQYRQLVGPTAPDWGAAVAFPESQRIVLQGSSAGSDAGDPVETLRHELAHLALHEYLGDLPPRWFDEGYASFAAHEWRREDAIATNLGLALRGMPTLDELEREFEGGSTSAQEAYALAFRAVSDLSDLGGPDGLRPLFENWKQTGSLDRADRASYGMTLSAFEERWRERTRRRYGALALGEGVVVGASLIGFLLMPLYLARRRRDRGRLAAMAAADAVAEAAEARSVLEGILGETAGDDPPSNEA